MNNEPARVIFAGGGSGGHIYPALAVAESIVELDPSIRCSFLCSTRPLDAQMLATQRLAGAQVDFEPIPAMPFGVRPKALFRFLTNWGLAVRTARAHIRARRAGKTRRAVLVATGGFVAAPAAQAAGVEGVPIVLVNLDAVPGRANRWVARRARTTLTSAPVAGRDWAVVPPIVRRGALVMGDARTYRAEIGLDPALHTLFVTGGSQGAGSINRFLELFVRLHADSLRGWQVIHQTGSESDAAKLSEAYARAGVRAVVRTFFDPIASCWGASDLCVCRAGAGNVAEVWSGRVPALFLPYPYHRDEHQKLNAEPLVRVGAAQMARDRVDAQANMSEAGQTLRQLLTSSSKLEEMRAALIKLGPTDGAERVAVAVLGMLG